MKKLCICVFLFVAQIASAQHSFMDILVFGKYMVIDTTLLKQPYKSYNFILDEGIISTGYNGVQLDSAQLAGIIRSIYAQAEQNKYSVLFNFIFKVDLNFEHIYDFAALSSSIYEEAVIETERKRTRLYLSFYDQFLLEPPNRIKTIDEYYTGKEGKLEVKNDGSYILDNRKIDKDALITEVEKAGISTLNIKCESEVKVGELTHILKLAAANHVRAIMSMN